MKREFVRRCSLLSVLFFVFFLNIVFAQDSLNIRQVSQTLLGWDWAYRVVVSGHYAYVATYETGLVIMDISNPTTPVPVSYTGGTSIAVAVNGDYAYVADEENHIRTYDVSAPSYPALIGQYSAQSRVTGLTVNGSYVYASFENGLGIRVLGAADPAHLVEVGHFGYRTLSIAIVGEVAYVGGDSLFIMNVADPANPTRLGYLPSPNGVTDIAISGSRAYFLQGYSALYCFDIGNPLAPVLLDTIRVSGATEVKIAGIYAFLLVENYGLLVIDIGDPQNLARVAEWHLHGNSLGMDISGTYAYVADGIAGLRALNMINPLVPIEVGHVSNFGRVLDVALQDSRAFIADDSGGVRAFDVSDPVHPFQLGTCSTHGRARAIKLQGDYAYVANDVAGLSIIRIANPENLVEVGRRLVSGRAVDVAVNGNYAWIAADSGGLHEIDVSDPSSPVEIETNISLGQTYAVAMQQDYAYVVGEDYGFRVLDISDPMNTLIVGGCDTVYGYDVAVQGNYAFLVERHNLFVLDISDPAHPFGVAEIAKSYDWASDISIWDHYAHVCSIHDGFTVIDIQDPLHPHEVGRYNTDGYAYNVAADDRYAYVADKYYLGIYDCSQALGTEQRSILQPTSFSLSAYPNPFNSTASIVFNLPKSAPVTLAVYNVMGQRVISLLEGFQTQGRHTVHFDATRFSSGIYFASLQSGQFTEQRRLVLLK